MTDSRSKRLTLVACILGSAIVFVDGTVVNVALPALRTDLGATLAAQQWIVEAYLLTLSALILVGGSLGDVLGRRTVFVAGVAGFGASSLLCAAAPSAEVLVASRAIQGVAGALLVPSSLAIVTAVFDEEERGAAIGSWTAWTSAAIAVGPPLGGALVDFVSWRAVFAINVPLVIACLWVTARAMPPCEGSRTRRVDWIGGALCALAFGGPVFALIHQPDAGWADPAVWAPFAAGVALFTAFLAWEHAHPDPMLPLGVFRSRNFAVGNVATFAIYAGLGGATFFVALFLQQVAGYSALAAGFSLMPITLLMVTLSRRSGALATRWGPRAFMGVGPMVAGAGLLLFGRLTPEADYVSEVLPAVAVFGLGLAVTVAPLTATVLAGAPRKHAGVASGVNNAIARVAGLIAIAAVGAVVAARYDGYVSGHEAGFTVDAAAASQVDRIVADGRRERLSNPSAPPGAEPVARVVRDASVSGFHAGMVVTGFLCIVGGLICLVGIENPRRREAAVVGRAEAVSG